MKFVSHTYTFLRKYCTWQVDWFLTQQSSASINIREDPKQTERNFRTFELLLNKQLWIFRGQGGAPPATHRYESGGVPSDGACIWRPCHTRCIWTCGCRPLGWAVGAVKRGRERERDWKKINAQTRGGGESLLNKHNWSAWQEGTSQTAPVANEASWISTPTSAERLQAAAPITERITYLLISWLLSQRRHAFRIWQARK